MSKEKTIKIREIFLVVILLFIFLVSFVVAVDPSGPDSIAYGTNQTKAPNGAQMINISGGRILSMNITANVQDPRWKAFVGNVFGSFTLDDAGGSTIYDWSLTSVTGRIYTTRTSGAVSWSNIECANNTTMEQENINMNHTNSEDNITATFNDTTHELFWVGSTSITANTCPTLNTYVNNVSNPGAGQPFEEMALYDGANIVYATILEQGETGFDGSSYDFQMIVPENGLPSFTGATAYYLYVEIGT